MSGCLGDINNFLKNAKLDQVVVIIKSCTPNTQDDLTITLKDLSRTISGINITKTLQRVVTERLLPELL